MQHSTLFLLTTAITVTPPAQLRCWEEALQVSAHIACLYFRINQFLP